MWDHMKQHSRYLNTLCEDFTRQGEAFKKETPLDDADTVENKEKELELKKKARSWPMAWGS